MGATRPQTPRQGMIPWTRISGNYLSGRENAVPAVSCKRWKANKLALLSLSGTAAFGRQAGCKASGENRRKCRGKGRLSAKLARTLQLGSGFSPGIFAYFHCARKLAIFRPQRNTQNEYCHPSKYFREERVQGTQYPGGVWGKAPPSLSCWH